MVMHVEMGNTNDEERQKTLDFLASINAVKVVVKKEPDGFNWFYFDVYVDDAEDMLNLLKLGLFYNNRLELESALFTNEILSHQLTVHP